MNYDYCNGRIHTIQQGDTLYKISGMYRVPLALILRANPYVDIYNLQVGEKLCIPGGFDNETKPPQQPNCPFPTCQPPQDAPEEENPAMSGFMFIVQDGQSIQDILDRFDITWDDFMKENTLDDMILESGTAIRIPQTEQSNETED